MILQYHDSMCIHDGYSFIHLITPFLVFPLSLHVCLGNPELNAPLHLEIQNNDPPSLDEARKLAESLLQTVVAEYLESVRYGLGVPLCAR